jgi:Ca2+-binding RTX toxin-like protein
MRLKKLAALLGASLLAMTTVVFTGGAAHAQAFCFLGPEDPIPATIEGSGTIIGTRNADVIVGSPGPDRIFGLGGDDIICAEAGNDTVDAGAGDDVVVADGLELPPFAAVGGNDTVIGGPGNDALIGLGGRDNLSGATATTK